MTPFRVALISAIVGALLGVVGLHIYQVNASPDAPNLTVTYAPGVHSLEGVRMCSVDQFGDGTATGFYSVGNYKGTITRSGLSSLRTGRSLKVERPIPTPPTPTPSLTGP